MAWESLANRLDALPLVIAGPVLRRTEKDNVTVWIALKESRTVTLRVFEIETLNTTILSATGTTISVGANLHIVAVTATSFNNQLLVPDKNYFYDLTFTDSLNNSKDLEEAGIMGSQAELHNRYTYTPAYPSFSLPPSNVNNLRLLQASCRKPHGGKIDALVAIDKIIADTMDDLILGVPESNNSTVAGKRPHQLFHTGDQIYADDVDGTLLYMINDASKVLLDWEEDLPLGKGDAPTGFLSTSHINQGLPNERLPDMLLPGNREELVKNNGFTTGKSHLMTLGEFFCMYLFTWSDVLWPLEPDYPTFKQVYPLGQKEVAIYNNAGEYVQAHPTPLGKEYTDSIKSLTGFQATLPRVRRVLANIPNYMMCDDHEVTDDWFIDINFCHNVLGDVSSNIPKNQLTSRVIQNGLVAFALCQAWGNTPAKFRSVTSNEFLLKEKISLLSDKYKNNLPTLEIWKEIGDLVLPLLAPDFDPWSSIEYKKLTGGLEYYFNVDCQNYRVIVLDTRTKRRFKKSDRVKDFAADLLSTDALNDQIPALANGTQDDFMFTLLISPSPIIGHSWVESFLQEDLFKVTSFYLKENPKMELWFDKEGWSFNKYIYHELLQRLSQYRKVVVLSGDVHYSFSGQIEFWGNNPWVPGEQIAAKLVQLTASPSKNRTIIPSYLIAVATMGGLSLSQKEFIVWQSSGYHMDRLSTTEIEPYIDWNQMWVEQLPYFHVFEKDFERIREESKSQIWSRFKLSFLKDSRTEDVRGLDLPIGESNDTLINSSNLHRQRGVSGFRQAVGDDVIGEITFKNQAADQNESDIAVTHSFWYNIRENPLQFMDDFKPYTMHTASISAPIVGPD